MKNLVYILRMFKRNPLLVGVSIPGLAVGLSAVLLLSIYLQHELSFDRHFKGGENIVRLYTKIIEQDHTETYPLSLRKSYSTVLQKIPEVECATQICNGWNTMITHEKKNFSELEFLYVDSTFFKVFGLELIQGSTQQALQGKNKVVLTNSTALKIFNSTDCIGEVIQISEKPYTITGVMEDLPSNTHFHFDLLTSLETMNPDEFRSLEFYTYYRLNSNVNQPKVLEKLQKANDAILSEWSNQFEITAKSGLEHLTDIHLHTAVDFDLSPKNNIKNICIIAGIAILILLIAIINYINLYILNGEKRIAEIATRRALGASHAEINRLFYLETGIISLVSFLLALILFGDALPYFSSLMNSKLSSSHLYSWSGIAIISVILIVLTLISGAYPSQYLFRLNLVNALKGKSGKEHKKSIFSKLAVILQFTISSFLITSLIIIISQVHFLQNVPLGFNEQHLVGINHIDHKLDKDAESIIHEIEALPFVKNAATSQHLMGNGCSGQGMKLYGAEDSYRSINEYRITPGFCKTMEFELMDGRFFNTSEADKKGVIINEKAQKMLGNDVKAGTQVDMFGYPMPVIGIVKDFYYEDSPGAPVAPLVLTCYNNDVNNFYVRTDNKLTTAQQQQLEAVFTNHSPDYIYSQFDIKDIYANKFKTEKRLTSIVWWGAAITIIISFVGLLALSFLNVNRRKKEIGVRKVLGSSEKKVVTLLLTETGILIAIAMIFAFVLSYYLTHAWLQNFALHIKLSPVYFIISALITIGIAVLAVIFQSWRAATSNPVKSLRYE